ncbi:hypothetical protein H5410_030882 [Solanum commersonii]|uniref:CCDC93 coiled-coil domain-containing protein n=1 Tax=Solanum commersonii TaxID=4109 RepID=A0A9J5YIP6_SOLCO|nr:hypothetical protein H5410_030882 [Solanum commersonii]
MVKNEIKYQTRAISAVPHLGNAGCTWFKDALTSPAGRKKLIDSMEGILRGTQQKLEKVQIALQSEQKAHEALKGQYAAAVSEQRHNSILEAFQVECARNERIRMQTSQEHLAS